MKPDRKKPATKSVAKTRPSTAGSDAPPSAVMLQAQILVEASRLGLAPLTTAGSPAILEIVEKLTPSAYEAMQQLAVSDPDAFLKHFLSMAEFKLPKLARTELKVEGGLDMAHFVAVERREERPVINVTPAKIAESTAVADA